MKHFLTAVAVLFGMCAMPAKAADVPDRIEVSSGNIAVEICSYQGHKLDSACVDLVKEDLITYYITGRMMKERKVMVSDPIAAGVVIAKASVDDIEGIEDYITWCGAYFASGYNEEVK